LLSVASITCTHWKRAGRVVANTPSLISAFLPPYMARAALPCSAEYAAMLFPEALQV